MSRVRKVCARLQFLLLKYEFNDFDNDCFEAVVLPSVVVPRGVDPIKRPIVSGLKASCFLSIAAHTHGSPSYDTVRPGLAVFMRDAMAYYAEHTLTK